MPQHANIEQVERAIRRFIVGASEKDPCHWSELTDALVESGFCTRAELIEAMNGQLLPFSNIFGANHRFWIFDGPLPTLN